MADPYARQSLSNQGEADANQPSGDQTAVAKAVLFNMADPYAKRPLNVSAPQSPATSHPMTGGTPQQPATLTQAGLETYWNSMFEPACIATFSDHDKIKTFLKDITPQAGEDGKTVIITLTSSFAEYEVKKLLAEVMTYIRRKSGIHNLSPKIVVKAEEKASMPYQSGEKYEAMLQVNPMLAELRKVLPIIDI